MSIKLDFLSGYNPYQDFKTCDYIPMVNLDYLFDMNEYKFIDIIDNSVQLLRCRNGLHHIKNLNKLVNEILRILTKDGTIEIIEPNEEHYHSNIFLDKLYYRGINKRNDIWFCEYYRNYVEIFKEKGFELINYNKINEKEYCTFKHKGQYHGTN